MEQGYGGRSLERSRRSLSTSAPVPNEGEPLKDADVQMQPPAQGKGPSTTSAGPSQESPRQCEAAVRDHSQAAPEAPNRATNPPALVASSQPCMKRRSLRQPPPDPSPLEPPVTRATLSELDVAKIIHNPKLRHDINFDPELHFRPNIDGEKGRKNQDKANLFWTAFRSDLQSFLMDREAFFNKHGQQNNWTLPALLRAVKDIIQTLVPQRDRPFLDGGLNVDLLMQQFYKGVADLEKLSWWLAGVLKSHCAPMRDDWVDTMYKQLSNGNRDADIDGLVNGMRSLLSVLEAMKLDVANHQIRCLRPVLIEDTTHFERKFFSRKILSGKVDISGARRWYRNAADVFSLRLEAPIPAFGETAVFFDALVSLLLPSGADKRVPSSFLFDEERLMRLRSDLYDAIGLDVCMRMYEDLGSHRSFSSHLTPAAASAADGAASDRSVSPILGFNFNAPPTTSRPSSFVFSSAGSAASSPRSSWGLPSGAAPDAAAGRVKARQVYESLVALLHSATPTSRPWARWQELAPSLSLQIFRFTNAPPETLAAFEEKLAQNVCKPHTPLFQEAERLIQSGFMAELGKRVGHFLTLPGVSLFAEATDGRPALRNGQPQLRRPKDADSFRPAEHVGFDDIATRVAHLGVLHWRVWSSGVYLRDSEDVSMDVAPN